MDVAGRSGQLDVIGVTVGVGRRNTCCDQGTFSIDRDRTVVGTDGGECNWSGLIDVDSAGCRGGGRREVLGGRINRDRTTGRKCE